MYPQSNGSSERNGSSVQTVECILKKCDEDGSDPYLGLLFNQATPKSHHLVPPSELLNNRKLKTTLPMAMRSRVSITTSVMIMLNYYNYVHVLNKVVANVATCVLTT